LFTHPSTNSHTDSSLAEGRMRIAIICDETSVQWKLSSKYLIYSAEAIAILKAIEYTISKVDNSNITIFSDSLSALTSLQNLLISTPYSTQNPQFPLQLLFFYILDVGFFI